MFNCSGQIQKYYTTRGQLQCHESTGNAKILKPAKNLKGQHSENPMDLRKYGKVKKAMPKKALPLIHRFPFHCVLRAGKNEKKILPGNRYICMTESEPARIKNQREVK